jgi:predicted TIM-barrel fold metal-dependent hydrolase
MIVDFRVRPPFKAFRDLHLYRPRDPHPDPVTVSGLRLNMPAYRSFEEKSIDAFMEEMDEAGIDVGVVMGRQSPPPYGSIPNDEVAELVATYPGRFVGFGAVDAGTGDSALREIERCRGLGLKGIALDNGWSDPPLYDDDERIFPLYELCQREGLIVSLTSSIFVGPDMTYCMPVHIQRVAQRFKRLTIVVPHAGWPWTTEMCGVAFQNPNVYLIPDFYGHIPNTPGAEQYVRSANYFLSYRLLFGSSYPVRPLGQSVEQFKALPFDSEDIRRRGLGLNAARLLGLPT